MNTETPIVEGFTMTLEGATHGRYFIHTAGASTGINEVTEQKANVDVYSPTSRTIVVSSDSEIETVEVYDIGGKMLKRVSGKDRACTITDVNCGIAVVKVETEAGTHVSKLRIKN
ncbi:MAG: T9SS type A sorting domain-containing protein [Prevotella sp.]|nr:T9SS type A sorting domain-containing protein [Prevotella sp.]